MSLLTRALSAQVTVIPLTDKQILHVLGLALLSSNRQLNAGLCNLLYEIISIRHGALDAWYTAKFILLPYEDMRTTPYDHNYWFEYWNNGAELRRQLLRKAIEDYKGKLRIANGQERTD